MIEIGYLLNILIAKASVAGEVSKSTTSLTLENWITIFTSIGAPVGGVVIWLTTQQKKQYDVSVRNLKEAYAIEKRNFNYFKELQEAEIKALNKKIKRLQDFYSMDTIDDKTSTLFELLLINLTHIKNRLSEPETSEKIDIIKNFIETEIIIEGKRKYYKIASDWLKNHQEELLQKAVKKVNNDYSRFGKIKDSKDEFTKNIKKYLNWVIVSLEYGKPLSTDNIPNIEYVAPYETGLRFIKDQTDYKDLDKPSIDAIKQMIDDLINLIS